MDKIQSWLNWSSNRFGRSLARFNNLVAKALLPIGILCGVALVSMLFGLAIDASPASEMRMGSDWKYALQDPTWWSVAEKLTISMTIGYMLGIVPGAVLAVLVAVCIEIRKARLTEAALAPDFVRNGLFDLVVDGSGKIQDKGLLALHQHIHRNIGTLDQSHCQFLIHNRARIGSVELLPDGTATYSITEQDLLRYPATVEERQRLIELAALAAKMIAGAVAFVHGILAMAGLLLIFSAVPIFRGLWARVQFQRFFQREFDRLDANHDGLVDELEIIQLWPKLAESERPLLTKFHELIGEYGHEVLRDDGLTICGITRLEVDNCVPAALRLIV